MTEAAKVSAPALGMSVSVNLSERHAITMQTHVDAEADVSVFHAMADKITSVADRLIARYSLEALQKDLQVHESVLRRATQDLQDLDARHITDYNKSGKKGPMALTNAQEADRTNSLKSIERFKFEIDKIKSLIVEAQKKAT